MHPKKTRQYPFILIDDQKEPSRLTNCRHCGKSVYFVRHNEGSFWADELGDPWPLHPCMDEDSDEYCDGDPPQPSIQNLSFKRPAKGTKYRYGNQPQQRLFADWRIIDNRTNKVDTIFPYWLKPIAEQKLLALQAEYPGYYRLEGGKHPES